MDIAAITGVQAERPDDAATSPRFAMASLGLPIFWPGPLGGSQKRTWRATRPAANLCTSKNRSEGHGEATGVLTRLFSGAGVSADAESTQAAAGRQ